MKVAVVMGSPRKGDSFNLCLEIENELKLRGENIEFDYIFLNQYNIQECRGCSLCFQKSEKCCPLKDDDLNEIKEKIVNSDAVIFASPVYAYGVTSTMKKFIDRMSYLFHRQEMIGMPAMIVVTTDGGGSSTVYKYLKMTLSGWGMDVVGNVQIISSIYFKDRKNISAFGYDAKYYVKKHKNVRNACDKLYKSMNAKNEKIPTFYDIFMFNCLRSKTFTSKADRAYWCEKGWLNSDYFYSIHLGLAKKIFGCIMRKFIDAMGKKYLGENKI